MPPRLARLLAVVAAVALVAGAFVVRAALRGDDGNSDEGPSRPSQGGSEWSVLCDADLGDACDAIERLDGVGEVTTMAAGPAIDEFEGAPNGYDLWVTLDPIADVARANETTPNPDSAPVASTTLAAVLGVNSRLDCGDPVEWSCLLAEGGPPLGVPSPDSALGVVTAGSALAGLAGESADGDDVDAHAKALREPEPATTGHLASEILLPGNFAGVVLPRPLGERVANTPQGQGRGLAVHAIAGGPANDATDEAVIGVVVAPVDGTAQDAADLAETIVESGDGQTVRDALAAAGYDGSPAPSDGLPAPDVMYALREELS